MPFSWLHSNCVLRYLNITLKHLAWLFYFMLHISSLLYDFLFCIVTLFSQQQTISIHWIFKCFAANHTQITYKQNNLGLASLLYYKIKTNNSWSNIGHVKSVPTGYVPCGETVWYYVIKVHNLFLLEVVVSCLTLCNVVHISFCRWWIWKPNWQKQKKNSIAEVLHETSVIPGSGYPVPQRDSHCRDTGAQSPKLSSILCSVFVSVPVKMPL